MSFLEKLKDTHWERVKEWKKHFRARNLLSNSSSISSLEASERTVCDATDENDEHVESNVDIVMKTLKSDVSKLLYRSESKNKALDIFKKINSLERVVRSICEIQDGFIKNPCVREELLQEHKDMIVSLVRDITKDLDTHWNKLRREKKSNLGRNKRGIDSVLDLLKHEVVKMVDILVAKKSFLPCTANGDSSFSYTLLENNSFQSVLSKKNFNITKINKCQSAPVLPRVALRRRSAIFKKSNECVSSKQEDTDLSKFTDSSIHGNLSEYSQISNKHPKLDPNYAVYERRISQLKKKSSNILSKRNKFLVGMEGTTFQPSKTSTALYTLAQSSVDPFSSESKLVLDSSRRIGAGGKVEQSEVSEDSYCSCLPTKEGSKVNHPSVGAMMRRSADKRRGMKDNNMASWETLSASTICASNEARRSDPRPAAREPSDPTSTEALTNISTHPDRTIALNSGSLKSFSRPTISNVSFVPSQAPPTGVRCCPPLVPVVSQPLVLDSKFSRLYLSSASTSPLRRERES